MKAKRVVKVKSVPTKRAADVWDSARFSSSFLASSFSCSRIESRPAHTRLTQTVGQPSAKTKSSLIRKFRFIVEFGKANSLFQRRRFSSSRLFRWLCFLHRQKFGFNFTGFRNRLVFLRHHFCSNLVLIGQVGFFQQSRFLSGKVSKIGLSFFCKSSGQLSL